MAERSIAAIYFAILGIITTAFGIADILVTMGAGSFAFGILEIPGDLFRGGWGGFIVLSAGLFYLSGIRNFEDIHQFSKIVMGSILIWIMAGCDIFACILAVYIHRTEYIRYVLFTRFSISYLP